MLGKHIKLKVHRLPGLKRVQGCYRMGVRRDPAGERVRVIVDFSGSQADALDCYRALWRKVA